MKKEIKTFIATAFYCSLLGLLLSCSSKNDTKDAKAVTFKAGKWQGTLDIQGQPLPFLFEVEEGKDSSYQIYLLNASERLLLDDIRFDGDSVYIPMHIFDAEIKAKCKGDQLEGYWKKRYAEDYSIPFKAIFGKKQRFTDHHPEEKRSDFSGTWDVTFVHEKTDTTKAIGLFEQNDSKVTGTFMTATGDYRFIEGIATGDSLLLSTFDGEHAYLFKALQKEDGTLEGSFWSGKQWHATWTAQHSDSTALPDANQLTYLKEGYSEITFSFPNLQGEQVSPQGERYKNKVLILQILGTWCPNCMDETKFLAPWYQKNKGRGVEIMGLAYENKDDFDYAKKRLAVMKEKLGVDYELLIAGTRGKDVSATLPMLNHIMSFPTTIFIGKDGKVKKIHTGFNGPGTGSYYEAYVKDFNETVDGLLAE